MKKLVGFVSVCCVLGLAAAPALSQTYVLVPVGEDPAGGPYSVDAVGKDLVAFDLFVSDSAGLAVGTFQSTMPCSASGGGGGSIDWFDRELVEARADYIFFGLPTLGEGGSDGACPSVDINDQPNLGSLVIGAGPVVSGWVYLGVWTYSVSSDARGAFTLDLICADSPPSGGCPATLTFIVNGGGPIPPSAILGVTINVPTGDCCTGPSCAADLTQWECESGGGTFREGGDCSQDCACETAADCEDNDACTDNTCPVPGGQCAFPAHDCSATDCNDCDPNGAEGNCALPANENGACTDDGDTCTTEACVAGACVHTVDPCDDNDPCTANDCIPGAGCNNPPNGTCSVDMCIDAEAVGGRNLPPIANDDCVPAGSQILVKAVLGKTTFDVVGVQVRIEFDPAVLALKSISVGAECDATSPFAEELGQKSGDGWAGIATHTALVACADDDDCPAGHPCNTDYGYCEKTAVSTNGGVVAACFWFEQIGDQCDKSGICYVDANPWQMHVVDKGGNNLPISDYPNALCDKGCDNIIPDTPLELKVPDDINENSECDKVTAEISWDAPTVNDKCGDLKPVDCWCTELWGDLGECDAGWLANNGGTFPQGTYLFECFAQDNQCGDWDSGSWTVTVSDQTSLDIDIQLSPNMADKKIVRGIEFEAFSSCSPLKTDIFCKDISFGGAYNLPGKFQGELKIPKGQYACLSARDSLHTLRASADIECNSTKDDPPGDGHFTTIFKGEPPDGNWLIGGNLDGNSINGKPHNIDILDYGLFVSMFLNTVAQDTLCEDKAAWDAQGGHGDINGDGIVDDADFTFIAINFMETDKDVCCPGGRAVPEQGLSEISVRELIKMGLGHLAVADLNADGMVDMDDMAAFLGGARPKDRPGIGR